METLYAVLGRDFTNAILLSNSFLVLFACGEVLYHVFNVKAELTRKWSHVGTGFLTLLFPAMLSNHWWVLVLCTIFAVLLSTSIKFNFLKSINAVDRDTVGSMCYPLAVYTSFLVSVWKEDTLFFYLPILIMALADPAAALVGKRWPWKPYAVGKQKKSVAGSLAFFAVSTVLSIYFLGGNLTIEHAWLILTVAVSSTLAEAFSAKGYDNVTIPWTVIAVCTMFI
jgi:phytol kinase